MTNRWHTAVYEFRRELDDDLDRMLQIGNTQVWKVDADDADWFSRHPLVNALDRIGAEQRGDIVFAIRVWLNEHVAGTP